MGEVDLPLWNEGQPGGEADPAARPAAAFPAQAAGGTAEELPTIGHIGRYALKYRIGEGGLGTVYAAHDPLLSRLIAIKTLNVEVPAEARASFEALFLNEARAAGSLSHPHIVTVFDAGVSEQGPYIAMELLKGRDLRQLRQEGWRPSPDQAAMIARRVADALGYAHAKGVVHRDIKPANIFMVGRTQPRVLDFGIARIAHQQDMLGDDSIAAGSPYYMAPEQLRQASTDRRTDVFSLGVVLYELLTGSKPFKGTTLAEINDAVLHHAPPPAHEVDPAVPPALSMIAERAMRKIPDDRYRSARGMSRDLRHWLEEQQQGDEPGEPAAKPVRRKAAWVLMSAATLLLGGGVWWLARPQAASAPPPAAALPDGAPSVRASPAASAGEAPSAAADAAPPLDAIEPAAAAAAAASPAARVEIKPAKPVERRNAAPREPRSPPPSPAPAAPAATGVLNLAVSPWGQIEVDGRIVGIAPPLTRLVLPEGSHSVTIRNDDFSPHTAKVNVTSDQPVTVKHKFQP